MSPLRQMLPPIRPTAFEESDRLVHGVFLAGLGFSSVYMVCINATTAALVLFRVEFSDDLEKDSRHRLPVNNR